MNWLNVAWLFAFPPFVVSLKGNSLDALKRYAVQFTSYSCLIFIECTRIIFHKMQFYLIFFSSYSLVFFTSELGLLNFFQIYFRQLCLKCEATAKKKCNPFLHDISIIYHIYISKVHFAYLA